MPTPQPVSSPPLHPCRSPGPSPSVPSPSCPEPRLSRVSKLTPAHNTPHEAISRLFCPQAAPATDSYFTHDQEQHHQSTALLRVVMEHLLTIQVASGSPLHSAPVQPSRAAPSSTPTEAGLCVGVGGRGGVWAAGQSSRAAVRPVSARGGQAVAGCAARRLSVDSAEAAVQARRPCVARFDFYRRSCLWRRGGWVLWRGAAAREFRWPRRSARRPRLRRV